MAIQTVRQREQLKPRREPYWHLLATGRHLGYRVTDESGYWVARAYDPATRKRVYRSLGDLGNVDASAQYSKASALASEWFNHLARGGEAEVITVSDAFQAYIKHQRKRKGEKAAGDAEARFKRHIEHDPIARIELTKLMPRHVESWRQRISERPASVAKRGKNARTKKAQAPARERSAATTNRDMVSLRAALFLAKRNGYVTTDQAWTRALEPVANADGRRDIYLTKEQRRALIAAIESSELRVFAEALCVLPLRPGALAALQVGDVDQRSGGVRITHDKANAGRVIPLPPAAGELFRKQAKNKLPRAFLFTRADGKQWDKDSWKGPIKAAVLAAELPQAATLYALRHAAISDLATSGLDLFSVARLAGTSVRMIEKTYGHLQADRARDALAGLAL